MTGHFQHRGSPIGSPSFFQAFHPPQFDVTVNMEAHTAVVAITGELDPETVGQVRDVIAVVAGRADGFVFDLSGVTFMDLAGVEPIVDQYRVDGRPSVISPSRIVRSLLTAAGLEGIEMPDAAGQPGWRDTRSPSAGVQVAKLSTDA